MKRINLSKLHFSHLSEQLLISTKKPLDLQKQIFDDHIAVEKLHSLIRQYEDIQPSRAKDLKKWFGIKKL